MYPVVWEPFGFPISSFGVMMALGFLAAAWLTAIRLREEGLDPEFATTAMLYAMVGGVIGAKLYFAIDTHLRTGAPFLSLLLSRDGITWFGGLMGGTLACAIGCRVHGVPVRTFANCVCIGAAVGQALGRVGCFLVGDDYGRPTDLPWGVSFAAGVDPPRPDPNVLVHPTQLYEMVWLLAVAGFLWGRRRKSPFLFGEYMMLAGVGRFAVEVLRINPRVALGLTEPQWIGIGLLVLGAAGWVYYRGRPQPAAA